MHAYDGFGCKLSKILRSRIHSIQERCRKLPSFASYKVLGRGAISTNMENFTFVKIRQLNKDIRGSHLPITWIST